MTKRNDSNHKSTEWNCTMAWDRSRQRLHAGAVLLAACAFAASAPVWAQDVAEAARQAQARKDKNASHLKHVYTDDDLKRARILTREDRELLDARKREQPAPAATPAPDLDAQSLDQLPLGDVARMFRALKELRSQTGESADYHLPYSDAVLAAPRFELEFVMPKPRAVQPATRRTPAAPVLIPAAETTPSFELAATKPLAPQPAIAEAPSAPVLSAVSPLSPKNKFLAPRPLDLQPSASLMPEAPVLPNGVTPPTVIVKRGDSFWKLAQVNLGDGRRWHELAAVNPSITDPQHLVPGMAINIVPNAPAVPPPPSAPTDNVTVRKGDSLWKIAKLQLGSGGFWGCIAKANPMILDANRIFAGQVLTVPTNCEDSESK
jgi:nucleoid-associated protein YgaU